MLECYQMRGLLPDYFPWTYIEFYKFIVYKVIYGIAHCRTIEYLHVLNPFAASFLILYSPSWTHQKTEGYLEFLGGGRFTAQKQETTDLVTFTGEILNGKLQFWCSDWPEIIQSNENLQV